MKIHFLIEIIIRLTKTQKEGSVSLFINNFLEASICYLLGVAYSQQSDLDNAKQWFKKSAGNRC
ncbi:hypothetical protein C2G38_2101799, partial [Gigaspora rosea]